MTDPAFDAVVPVVVVGGGACGTVAALAAHEAGAEVLLVERDAHPHGTTSMSQGLVCAAGTAAQREAGVDDDADRFLADIVARTRGRTDLALARTIAAGSGPCLDWLVAAHDLPWRLDVRFAASYGHSVPRVHGWPGHGGTEMIELLHSRVAARGIDVLTEARLVDIVADADARARGIVVERPGGARERIGCDALVLAAGGFAADPALVARHLDGVAAAKVHTHEGCRGDAIVLGARLGGALADMGAYQGYAMLTDPQGVTVPPGFVVEGGLLVDRDGVRFVDETRDISGMVHDVLARPGATAWLVFDAAIEERCAYVPETRTLRALHAMRRASDVGELARIIGTDPTALERALADAQRAHATGTPDAVGRRWPAPPPHGALGALRVCGALYHTQGGLQVGAEARVLRPDGSPLPNVYAGGGSARGVSGPSCWGYLPAMGLCAAVTLGRLAGRAAAALVMPASSSASAAASTSASQRG